MRPICLVALLVPLHAANSAEIDAFKSLQALQGTWSIESKGKTIATEMTYAAGSKGSIVTEQFGHELSVFYRDGEALLMTHYCNVGNQPRLRLVSPGNARVLEFDMIDITNLHSPADPHVQRIIYRLLDDRKFGLDIIWQTGSENEIETYILTRK